MTPLRRIHGFFSAFCRGAIAWLRRHHSNDLFTPGFRVFCGGTPSQQLTFILHGFSLAFCRGAVDTTTLTTVSAFCSGAGLHFSIGEQITLRKLKTVAITLTLCALIDNRIPCDYCLWALRANWIWTHGLFLAFCRGALAWIRRLQFSDLFTPIFQAFCGGAHLQQLTFISHGFSSAFCRGAVTTFTLTIYLAFCSGAVLHFRLEEYSVWRELRAVAFTLVLCALTDNRISWDFSLQDSSAIKIWTHGFFLAFCRGAPRILINESTVFFRNLHRFFWITPTFILAFCGGALYLQVPALSQARTYVWDLQQWDHSAWIILQVLLTALLDSNSPVHPPVW